MDLSSYDDSGSYDDGFSNDNYSGGSDLTATILGAVSAGSTAALQSYSANSGKGSPVPYYAPPTSSYGMQPATLSGGGGMSWLLILFLILVGVFAVKEL